MKIFNAKKILFLILVASSQATANDNKEPRTNDKTKVPLDLSFTPSFRNIYEIDMLNIDGDCTKSDAKKNTLPKDSRFRETLDASAQTLEESIVHVYQIPATSEESNWFSKPFKLCKKGVNEVQKSNYKRIGGISTGLLVIPFKLRSGDIYSDSTVGPYISYKFERFEILGTAGISQIATSEIGTEKVESKSGLTYGAGVSFEIAKDWDIAVIVGKDHLSGDIGEKWQYQDKVWVSFAIGFNFTR
ncbi:hypothetical protein [Rheinheimera tilapiae]|uniref:Outer membrane protein beta-barrel domain-containing protein n=1 Tax=Rheinheimera tilapiae TaxID=875043 RepID=A0ABV6BJX4_9GAMM